MSQFAALGKKEREIIEQLTATINAAVSVSASLSADEVFTILSDHLPALNPQPDEDLRIKDGTIISDPMAGIELAVFGSALNPHAVLIIEFKEPSKVQRAMYHFDSRGNRLLAHVRPRRR